MTSPFFDTLPGEFSADHVLLLTPYVGSPSTLAHLKVYWFDGHQDNHMEERKSKDPRSADVLSQVYDISKMLDDRLRNEPDPRDLSVLSLAENINDIMKDEYYNRIIRPAFKNHKDFLQDLWILYAESGYRTGRLTTVAATMLFPEPGDMCLFFTALEKKINTAIVQAGVERQKSRNPFLLIRVRRHLKEWIALELVCSFSQSQGLSFKNVELAVGFYIEKTDSAALIASRIPESANFDWKSALSSTDRLVISCPPMSVAPSDDSKLSEVSSTASPSSTAGDMVVSPVTLFDNP
jgi:hypothetical protein